MLLVRLLEDLDAVVYGAVQVFDRTKPAIGQVRRAPRVPFHAGKPERFTLVDPNNFKTVPQMVDGLVGKWKRPRVRHGQRPRSKNPGDIALAGTKSGCVINQKELLIV